MINVSLCMIVKDEEALLRRCLDSFKALVDEIVIVDTGSVDSTKQIAAEYTDKLYDFKWTGDFSEARNFAFSKCSCDYIYSADADEYIDEENAAQFMAVKEVMDEQVELVQMWYVNRHEFRTTENYERDLRPKLYKRLRQFVWIDPVHESVRLDPVVFDSDIEIIHAPISQHAGRDFSIYQKQLEAGRVLSHKLWHMYAQELYIAGTAADLEGAVPGFKKRAEETDDAWEYLEACAVLVRAARICGDQDNMFKYAFNSIIVQPCAEVCNEISAFYKEKGDESMAACWSERAGESEQILVDLSKAS